MTNFFYPVQRHATSLAAGFALIRWLCNELPGFTGPNWTVIEADDKTNINVGPNLSDLGASNLWNPANGSPPEDAWIVLESLDSNNTNHFQWFFQVSSTTNFKMFMIPLENFVTGAGTTGGALPRLPTTAYGDTNNQTSSVDMTVTNGTARYSATATEGNVIFFHHSSIDMTWYYAGEVDNPDATAPTPDDRAYLHYFETDFVHVKSASFQENWTRLSPVDDTTIIGFADSDSRWSVFKSQDNKNPTDPTSDERGHVDGEDPGFPAGVYFRTVGHDHLAGFLRNVRTSYGSLGRVRLSNDKTLLHVCNDQTQTGISFLWDGSTAYG